MSCTICGCRLRPQDFQKLELKHVQTHRTIEEDIKSETTFINFQLCSECCDKIQCLIINQALETATQQDEPICNKDCAACTCC